MEDILELFFELLEEKLHALTPGRVKEWIAKRPVAEELWSILVGIIAVVLAFVLAFAGFTLMMILIMFLYYAFLWPRFPFIENLFESLTYLKLGIL